MKDYQKMYEDVKSECDMVRLRNDELSKMAYVMNQWKFNVNCEMKQDNYINRMKSYCKKFKKIYIYGAGKKAERAVVELEELEYVGFVVSDQQRKAPEKLGHKIYEISEISEVLKEDGCVLIVALNPENTLEILPSLSDKKMNAIYFME